MDIAASCQCCTTVQSSGVAIADQSYSFVVAVAAGSTNSFVIADLAFAYGSGAYSWETADLRTLLVGSYSAVIAYPLASAFH